MRLDGVNSPRIVVGETTINLPFPSQMSEIFTLDSVRAKLQDGDISVKKRGWRYRAELNYGFLTKETLESLEAILTLSGNFKFYPRSDNLWWFNVTLMDDLRIEQAKNHSGHKNLRLIFSGTTRLSRVFDYYLSKEESTEAILTEDGDFIVRE